jgi:hypothetical protein
MNLVIIGSYAALMHGINLRRPLDFDLIADRASGIAFAESQGKILEVEEIPSGIIIYTNNMPVEVELIEKREHTRKLFDVMSKEGAVASKDWQYFLKMSHRYKKNSPHFMKTMRDIWVLRERGAKMPEGSEELFKEREKLTYDYGHPKLAVSKNAFFDGDGVKYIYDHDSLHLTQASFGDDSGWRMPAYSFYMQDGAQVMTSKEKFFSLPKSIQLAGVYEEACVLALERSQIPFDFKPDPESSFMMALSKVCTSITSGWFREFAWENWHQVVDIYQKEGKNSYVEKFHKDFHLAKPFEGVMQ